VLTEYAVVLVAGDRIKGLKDVLSKARLRHVSLGQRQPAYELFVSLRIGKSRAGTHTPATIIRASTCSISFLVTHWPANIL